jgi:hypothetical protein
MQAQIASALRITIWWALRHEQTFVRDPDCLNEILFSTSSRLPRSMRRTSGGIGLGRGI